MRTSTRQTFPRRQVSLPSTAESLNSDGSEEARYNLVVRCRLRESAQMDVHHGKGLVTSLCSADLSTQRGYQALLLSKGTGTAAPRFDESHQTNSCSSLDARCRSTLRVPSKKQKCDRRQGGSERREMWDKRTTVYLGDLKENQRGRKNF